MPLVTTTESVLGEFGDGSDMTQKGSAREITEKTASRVESPRFLITFGWNKAF